LLIEHQNLIITNKSLIRSIEKSTENSNQEWLNLKQMKVLTFEQGCRYFGYSKSYVYKMTSAGILPFSKTKRKKYIF